MIPFTDAAGDCYTSDLPNQRAGTMNMRQLTLALALALAIACIFVASCSRGQHAASTTTSSTRSPVAVNVLYGLLLTPEEISTAMGTTGIEVSGTDTTMFDNTDNIPDPDCRFIHSAATSVYDGSGWTAMLSQDLHEPGEDFDDEVWQTIVLFRSANDAARFFSASAQRWPRCSNRQFRYLEPGEPDKVWTVGPSVNAYGTLRTTAKLEGGWSCQRALTVSNNAAVDVAACSLNPADAAVNIADQIADKVGFAAY